MPEQPSTTAALGAPGPPEVCQECGTGRVVAGFGAEPRWLCQRCLDAALARVGALTRKIREVTEAFYAR